MAETWDRATLLAEGNRLAALYRDGGSKSADINFMFDAQDLHDVYRAELPEVVVARCPFTGEVVRWALDNVDLDGWFWDYEHPVRRRMNPVPRKWLAMGGAVRLAEPIAVAPFRVEPGPDVPYVVPEILGAEGIRAVVSQIPIGPHTGWAITYFGEHRPRDLPLQNTWGSQKYDVYDDAGHWRAWSEYYRTTSDYDFELRPWVESGKLLWIAPGDGDAVLREGVAGCPYLDIGGTRLNQAIHKGEVRRF